MRDRWCPNCQQRVAPRLEVGWLPTIIGWTNLAALLLAFRWLPLERRGASLFVGAQRVPEVFGDWIWTIVLTIVAVSVASWWLLRWLTTRSLCPLCRTEHLVIEHA